MDGSEAWHKRRWGCSRRWWDDRILAWAMADESVKVQMFRFIDVLPTLRTASAIARPSATVSESGFWQ